MSEHSLVGLTSTTQTFHAVGSSFIGFTLHMCTVICHLCSRIALGNRSLFILSNQTDLFLSHFLCIFNFSHFAMLLVYELAAIDGKLYGSVNHIHFN